ncbi:unnamed protein product [Camellia sinensis]
MAEKAEHLEVLLEPLGKHVRSYYGNQGGGTLPKDTSVAVCTIEKANSLINRFLEEGRLLLVKAIYNHLVEKVQVQAVGRLILLVVSKLLIVLDDLSRAREGFVLASDLHLVYLVTPTNVEVEPDWKLYYERFMQLSTLDQAPVLFKGIGHSLNSANNLAMKVLGASPSAYSANPKSKLSNPPSLTGSAISLVSVVQARNNARIMTAGFLDMFSNGLFKSGVQKAGSSNKYEKSGNEQFVTELSKWVFHERGHLEAVNVRHHKVGEIDEPAIYRINDDL